jgi:broad specificity phosphatase PhoE
MNEVEVPPMTRMLHLLRHTDNDGDVLTEDGVAAARRLGGRLHGDYALAVSTGAQRATQTLACILAAPDVTVTRGVIVEPGLRSDHEDRWRDAYRQAGGGELADFERVAADFVADEARTLGAALRRVADRLDDGDRALIVGHSPTNEAAVYGVTGERIASLGKGEGVTVVIDGDRAHVERGTRP